MLMDLLVDNRGILLIITILAWAWFLWAFMRNRQPVPAKPGAARPGAGNRVALPRKPADVVPLNRTSTGGLAPSIEAGIAEHQVRSSAPTAKLATQPSGDKVRPTESSLVARNPATDLEIGDDTDTEAKDELFSGLQAEAKVEAPPERKESTPAMQRSERLQEMGFHHPIEAEKALPASAPPPMAEMVTPGKPRTQTAELDDILKRIDQVLADNPPPPTDSVLLRALPTLPPRPVEKLDPSDVLKRIDEALAEGHGGRANQMTMPRPDWEDEAKKVASGEVPIVKAPAPPPSKPPTAQIAKPAVADEIPDWAKSDIQDEDLPAKPTPATPPAPPANKSDTKSESDGKGETPGQQRLF
jgi:hypothetical protein